VIEWDGIWDFWSFRGGLGFRRKGRWVWEGVGHDETWIWFGFGLDLERLDRL
jgi:hypothetical protein